MEQLSIYTLIYEEKNPPSGFLEYPRLVVWVWCDSEILIKWWNICSHYESMSESNYRVTSIFKWIYIYAVTLNAWMYKNRSLLTSKV